MSVAFGSLLCMPSHDHEFPLELIQQRPAVTATLLQQAVGFAVPDHTDVKLGCANTSERSPTEYHADAAVVFEYNSTPVLVAVVEVQRSRDPRKRLSWPVYLATLRARYECPVVLLVLCPDAGLADWCRSPIHMGHPSWVLTPLVVGSKEMPAVTDYEQAVREPELAVLSALVHSTDLAVLDALVEALVSLEANTANDYTDYVLDMFSEHARALLEGLMSQTKERKSAFARRYVAEGHAEGRAEGRAEDVVAVLMARGLDVPAEVRGRVLASRDLEELGRWLHRAATVDAAVELFDADS